MTRVALLSLTMAAVLAGCGPSTPPVLFDGKVYPARVDAPRADRRDMTITVRRADQGLAGALQAGRHAATAYCVQFYGNSAVEWTVGPQSPAEDLRLTEDGALILRGRCIGR